MAGSSDAGRPETDLARIGLGVRRELGNRRVGNRWTYHYDEGEANDARDGRDVAQKNEIKLVVEGRIDRVCRTDHEEHVAVWRRPHDCLGANICSGAWPIVDDEGLAESLREPWSHEP